MKELKNQWLQEILNETYEQEVVDKTAYSHLRLMRNLCNDIDTCAIAFHNDDNGCVEKLSKEIKGLTEELKFKIVGRNSGDYMFADLVSKKLFNLTNELGKSVEEYLEEHRLFGNGIPGKPKEWPNAKETIKKLV